MIKRQGTAVKRQGKIVKPFVLPKITFEYRGRVFPNYIGLDDYASGQLSVNSSVANVMYLDFKDDTPIMELPFPAGLTYSLRTSAPIKVHAVAGTYFVDVWFKYPTKVTSFRSNLVTFYGDFPLGLAYYNLDILSLTNSRYDKFPTDYGATVLNKLQLSAITIETVKGAPAWMLKSDILHLIFGTGFDFSNNKDVEDLSNIKNITSLTFSGRDSNLQKIPDVFKTIPTLRRINLGGSNSRITSITKEINAITQLEVIAWGYTNDETMTNTIGATTLTSWGYGIVGMPNIREISVNGASSTPTSTVPGFKQAENLKALRFRDCFQTQERLNTAIDNLYLDTSEVAEKTGGITLLRSVVLEVQWIASNSPNRFRPTGVYQAPVGFVLGVSNGEPASQMEKIYVLVKQYRWRITTMNETNNGTQVFAP